MTKRKHRTPEQWESIYQDFQASDLSMPKFCAQINIPSQSLYNYSRRRSPTQTAPMLKKKAPPAFVELEALATNNQNQPVEIVLDIGKSIQLRIRHSA